MSKPLRSAKAEARLVFLNSKDTIVLMLLLASALVSSGTAAAQDAQERSVNSFESAEELTRFEPLGDTAIIEQSTEHVTEGKHSLRVNFRSDGSKYSGLRVNLRREDGSPADWSDFRTLKLDGYNPYYKDRPPGRRRSSARIDFTIRDAKGNTWWHGCVLSQWASQQALEVALVTTVNKMSATEGSHFDFSSVVDVTMKTKRPDEDLVLFFDNMRLVPKERGRPEGVAPARPIPERLPFRTLPRDFIFTQHYHPNYPYEEKGFFRLGKGPVVLRLSQPGLDAGEDLPGLLGHVSELRQRQIPFHVILYNFWYGMSETYDEATTRLREAVAAFQASGGELFEGVWLHELEAVNYYRIVSERTSRLGKANAYVEFLRKFIRDLELPSGKLLVVNRAWFTNYGLDYEAGVDAVLPETLFGLDNIELCMAQTRGMARSFGRWCGGDTARYSPSVPPTAKYNRNGSVKPVKIDFQWWQTSDVYKAFIQHYYNGADILRGQSEWPGRRPEDGAILDHFLTFVQNHPGTGKVISSIAIVRSKGDYWEGASLAGAGKRLDRDGYRPADWTKREELDFVYLNAFFPGFSDDGYTANRYWTGTPYGPIDVIYPAIPLQTMKDYDVLMFMGFHRMDSVRGDFLADLTRYVEMGGTVLLAVDDLRMSDENFAPAAAIRKLVGAEIAKETRPVTSPVHVVENKYIRFSRDSYQLPTPEASPAAHEVVLATAVPVATDATGLPILLRNYLGKGCVLLLMTPTLSTVPPAGKNAFIRDLIAAVASSARQPVSISSPSEHVEFVLRESKDGRAVVFLMNHERPEWTGKVVVDLDQAGILAGGAPEVSLVVCRGYESSECKINVSLHGRNMVIQGVKLPGGTEQFDPYRAASFGVLTIRDK